MLGAGQWTIGIDTGGTFTDLVAVSAYGEVQFPKVSSAPDDPARAVFTALARTGLDLDDQLPARTDAALVTRGAGGLGAAIAAGSGERSATVAIADWDQPEGVAVAQATKENGGRASGWALDVSRHDDVEDGLAVVDVDRGNTAR